MCFTLGSVVTFATAFVRTPTEFVVAQMLARTFVIAATAVAIVIVVEELPAAHRAGGSASLAPSEPVGHGLAAALFAFVEVLPYGWRFLYGMGAVALLLLPWLRRNVPETDRFLSSRDTPAGGWVRRLAAFVTMHPGRALAASLLGVLPAMGFVSAFQFTGVLHPAGAWLVARAVLHDDHRGWAVRARRERRRGARR